MAENTKIEWATHTANLWWGCEEVHDGCDNCYARIFANRYHGNALWGKDSVRMEMPNVWKNFDKFQRQAKAANRYDTVFVGSMMDIGEKPHILINQQGVVAIDCNDQSPVDNTHIRERYFEEVVPKTPNLIHLMLTKRPSYLLKVLPSSWLAGAPANVMFGTSIVQRKQLDTLLVQLKRLPGRRFVSLEPQLENIPNINLRGIDWVIQGGESGQRKRPFNTDWARAMKYQCLLQSTPYFFKQIDKVQAIPDDLQIRQFPTFFQNPYEPSN